MISRDRFDRRRSVRDSVLRVTICGRSGVSGGTGRPPPRPPAARRPSHAPATLYSRSINKTSLPIEQGTRRRIMANEPVKAFRDR